MLSSLSRISLVGAAVLCMLVSVGCASKKVVRTAARPVPVQQAKPVAIDPGPSSYEGEIGGLSQEDFEEQFQALRPRLLDCVRKASSRLGFIGGNVTLRLRVDRRGTVRWVYLSDSTLGDRETERCVLQVVQSRKWPRPLSGDGLAQTSFDVEAAESTQSLPAFKRNLLAQRARNATRKCRKGFSGEFRATAYLSPKGEVIAAGVAPPDEKGEEASDCIVEALRDLRVGALVADQRAAKTSFRIAP